MFSIRDNLYVHTFQQQGEYSETLLRLYVCISAILHFCNHIATKHNSRWFAKCTDSKSVWVRRNIELCQTRYKSSNFVKDLILVLFVFLCAILLWCWSLNSRNLLHLVILIPLIYSINIEWHFWRENSSVNFWNSIIKQQLMRSGIEERKTKSAIFQFSSSLGKAPHENQPKSSRLRFITEETDKIEMFPTCRMERTFS